MESEKDNSIKHPFGEFLTTAEALNLLGISRSTLNKLRNDGALVGYKLRHRKLYFKRSDLFNLFTNK